MKLIVGLGNPGKIYSATRHNIGFMVVDALAERITRLDVILVKPVAFMNLSGRAVSSLVKKYKIDLKDLLIACDDLDLDFGRIRFKAAGTSGGQRGLESVIIALGEDNFCRLRVGIGRPRPGLEAADYVLSPFSREEKKSLDEIIGRACDCILSWIEQGTEKTMNIFNKKE